LSKCPNCGSRNRRPYCGNCGTALIDRDHSPFLLVRDVFFDDFLLALASTAVVVVAPIRMVEEWARGSRDFSSPLRVFAVTVGTTSLFLKLVGKAAWTWVTQISDGDSSVPGFAAGLRPALYAYLKNQYDYVDRNPVEFLLNCRVLDNFISFPLMILVITILIGKFIKKDNIPVSSQAAMAVSCYTFCGVYLQALLIFISAYLLDAPVLMVIASAYIFFGSIVLIYLSVRRIRGNDSDYLLLRCVAVYLIAIIIVGPVQWAEEFIAMIDNPIFRALA